MLAVGGRCRNTVCVTRGDEAFVSQHIGDLDKAGCSAFFDATINRLLSSPKFPELATKLLTLQEMSAIWSNNPQKFEGILGSLANDNDLPDDLALQLLLGAFYGMASESFSALLHDAYPMPE